MKKIIISISVILIVVITVGFCYVKFGSEDNKKNFNSDINNQDMEVKDNKNEIIEDDVDTEVNLPNQEDIVDPSKNVEKDNDTSNSNNVEGIPNQSPGTQVQPPKDTSSSEVTLPNEGKTPEPEPIPEPPKIDPEYERLKELAVFKTYEACNQKSNEISLNYAIEGDVNYQNTSCSSVAYNGELLGYKLTIYFRDGSIKEYK